MFVGHLTLVARIAPDFDCVNAPKVNQLPTTPREHHI